MKTLLFTVSVLCAVGLRLVFSACPECDPNDYKPVCVGQYKYRSKCHLDRLVCLGKVDRKSSPTPCDLPAETRMHPTEPNDECEENDNLKTSRGILRRLQSSLRQVLDWHR